MPDRDEKRSSRINERGREGDLRTEGVGIGPAGEAIPVDGKRAAAHGDDVVSDILPKKVVELSGRIIARAELHIVVVPAEVGRWPVIGGAAIETEGHGSDG